MFITEHEYRVSIFCAQQNIEYIPLTAMTEELFQQWLKWINGKVSLSRPLLPNYK
jgi:hypothetical protein